MEQPTTFVPPDFVKEFPDIPNRIGLYEAKVIQRREETPRSNTQVICIIDDEHGLPFVIETKIESSFKNVRIFTFSNPIKFLNWLTSTEGVFPDLVFTDVNMGKRTPDGIDLRSFIKSICDYLNWPIIIRLITNFSIDQLKHFDEGIEQEEHIQKGTLDFYYRIKDTVAQLLASQV